MELFVEVIRVNARGRSLVGPVRPVNAPVRCAVNGTSEVAEQFHDVDFTAGRPPLIGIVGTKHPNRRPNPLAFGKDGTHVDPSVLEFLEIEGFQSR